ncbi:MAG: hypothetical protein KatS3mg109_0427 [Pirellulaceae bacterium]|nr:MAG: hypothetical protein KatS3mg109_0427 [Pirellulaceae bacterium]
MISIQARSYQLPTTTTLTFFRDAEHFAQKVRDHFLNAGEPWSRLLGVRFLRQLRQKLAAGEVSILEVAYDRVLPVLDGGISFAAALPLFVRYQAVSDFGGGNVRQHEGYFLLAKAGFKVVAHGGIVRTAYFLAKTPRDSAFTLFRQAWKAIKARALTRQYVDDKAGRTVVHRRVEWFSPENWARCPNPHRKPRTSPRPGKLLPSEVEYWLERVDNSASGEG